MTNFTNDNIDNTPSKFINTYLVNLDIYGSNVQTFNSQEGYYHISYDKKISNDSDVIYNNKSKFRTSSFKMTDIYLLPLIHNNISNITTDITQKFIGEVAIKLVNTSNISCPLYLFYLVKSAPTNKGTDDANGQNTGSLSKIYDKIIKKGDGNVYYKGDGNVQSIEISPGTDGTIPNQDGTGCIMYINQLTKNKSEIHCIFLNPITISNSKLISFFGILNTTETLKVFKNYPSDGPDNILTSSTAKPTDTSDDSDDSDSAKTGTSATAGATSAPGYDTNSQIYIDCSPTGVSDETIASYNLPINSTLIQDIQHSSLATLCANFVLFGFILAAAYIGIPTIYNLAINKITLDSEKKTMVMYSKLVILLYFLLLSIILFIDGNSSDNIYELMGGILLIFLSILSYILLSSEELQRQVEPGSPFDFKFGAFIISILSRIMEQSAIIVGLWITLLLILLLIWGFAKNKEGDRLIDGNLLWRLTIFIGVFVIPPFVGLITWITS
jgi:hypothetical protein